MHIVNSRDGEGNCREGEIEYKLEQEKLQP